MGWSQLNGDLRVPQHHRHGLARSDFDKEQSYVLPDGIIGTAWFVLTLLTCWYFSQGADPSASRR